MFSGIGIIGAAGREIPHHRGCHYLRFKRQSLTEFDLAAHHVGADETLTVLLAEIQQIVTAGTLLVGPQDPPNFRPL
jgi:hypothetical protein